MEHGHHRRIRWGRRTFPRDYRPDGAAYPAAGGRRDHATFGSGPMCQSDERDSEPDYLLRQTRHGPGGTLLDYSAFLLAHKSPRSG